MRFLSYSIGMACLDFDLRIVLEPPDSFLMVHHIIVSSSGVDQSD